nr:universal stress protein [uncultured Carboxylicivirga sp.]
MRKILFPFQLNKEHSKEAFVMAVKLARNLNAELIMLNVFDIKADEKITQESINRQIRDNWLLAYNEVAKFNNYFLSKYARITDEIKVRFDHRFVYGREIDEILSIISKEAIDILVLPYTNKKSENKETAVIMEKDIFSNLSTSLLLIPEQFKFRSIHDILFTTDLKEHHRNESYFNEVVKYAKIFDARIHFVHFYNIGEKEPEMDDELSLLINKIIASNNKHSLKMLQSPTIQEGVEDYVNEFHIDMISVIKEDENFWTSLFHKSTSKDIVSISKIPVLYMVEKTKNLE